MHAHTHTHTKKMHLQRLISVSHTHRCRIEENTLIKTLTRLTAHLISQTAATHIKQNQMQGLCTKLKTGLCVCVCVLQLSEQAPRSPEIGSLSFPLLHNSLHLRPEKPCWC